MLVGPSGIGKTETALTLAEALYGGEQNMITINMSEFQEAHTVSTLKGSPPGYVGYGEGGVLTEAVRRRPYSVVLLDEVEKAHPDVHEIFFQVFDKGWMEDGRGHATSISRTRSSCSPPTPRRTCIINMCKDPELMPERRGLEKAMRAPADKVFPDALLNRLMVVSVITRSARKCCSASSSSTSSRVEKRVKENHKVPFTYDDSVPELIGQRCTELERGARMVDALITNNAAGDRPRIPRPPGPGQSPGPRPCLRRRQRLHLRLRLTKEPLCSSYKLQLVSSKTLAVAGAAGFSQFPDPCLLCTRPAGASSRRGRFRRIAP